ncbi:MAG: anaerobic ribonucleoside-triphosphate reductase activating protein [Halarsenatibacteraceae bacterium]
MAGVKFAGIQPTSLIDFPDQIATVLFTAGCNLRCPYCHNHDLIEAELENYYSEADILEILEERQGFIDGVSITGGEPLLQTDLKDFIEQVKELDLLVKLDTNGMLPDRLQELVEAKLLDLVAWDYKLPAARYDELGGPGDDQARKSLMRTGNILSEARDKGELEVEVRTTVVPELISHQDIEIIARELAERSFDRYVIQNFRPEEVLVDYFSKISPFSLEVLQEFKVIAEKYIKEVKIRDNI